MARYGRDFSTGRDVDRHFDDFGSAYDAGFRRGARDWDGSHPDRGYGFDRSHGHRGWGGSSRDNGASDHFRWSMAEPRYRFGGYPRDRSSFSDYSWDRGNFSEYPGDRPGFADFEWNPRFGSPERYYSDRPRYGYGGPSGREYDEDFRDRIRRGWDRFRNEAREWMGRGYDRGW